MEVTLFGLVPFTHQWQCSRPDWGVGMPHPSEFHGHTTCWIPLVPSDEAPIYVGRVRKVTFVEK